ncbi:MAG: TonB-dependent siderophore receptor [Aquisalimonadaceae bacterium]
MKKTLLNRPGGALAIAAALTLGTGLMPAQPALAQSGDHTGAEDLRRDAYAVPLAPIAVTADSNRETANGPVNGYAAKRSATGTRTDTPLLETPVSVQSVSREVMEDQQVLSVGDAVKNVSGVYERQGPDGNTMDSFNIRGFQVDSYGATYLDGVKDFSRAPNETAGLERIEVLKGPAAIMYGRIEPGGMINRVSKKPLAEDFTRIQQQVGSDNYLRATIDTNGRLSEGDSVLYRVNLAAEDGDGYKDDTDFKRVYLAPQIEWRPSERTYVRTGLEYQENDRSWALTYGTIGDDNGPVDVPIDTNLHDSDDRYTDDSLAWRLSWGHELNERWSLTHRLTYVDRNSVAQGSSLSAADANGDYTRTYWGWEDESNITASTNLNLTGKFSTAGISHTLLLGADYFDEDYDSGGWAFGGTPQPSNIYNPNNSDAPYDQDYTVTPFWYKNKNTGVYIQDQMAMQDDRLHVLLGTRYDSADYTYHYGGTEFNPKDEELTWRAGVLYKLQPNWSVYASYVEGFGSSNFSWGTGEIFDPQTSHQYEVGTKFEPTERSSLTLSAFKLVKDNLTMADPADITRTILAGEATSEGIELDFAGQLTDNWQFLASYAYTDVKYTRSDRFQGERLHSIPRHGANLWSVYHFDYTGWRLGGGLTHRSERLGVQRGSQPALYPYKLDAYTTLDLMLGYSFFTHRTRVDLQLNVKNATNEEYHPATYGSPSRIAQGEPRMIIASMKVDF